MSFGNTATTPSTPNVQRIVSAEVILPFATPASTQINPGDWLLFNTTTGQVALSSNLAWDTNLATTQGDAAPLLLGVSMGQKNAADASNTPIPVCVKGSANYPCAALGAAHNPGEYVSWAGQGTNNLADQQVAITATLANAMGKLNTVAPSGGLFLTYYFQSTLIYGALNAA